MPTLDIDYFTLKYKFRNEGYQIIEMTRTSQELRKENSFLIRLGQGSIVYFDDEDLRITIIYIDSTDRYASFYTWDADYFLD